MQSKQRSRERKRANEGKKNEFAFDFWHLIFVPTKDYAPYTNASTRSVSWKTAPDCGAAPPMIVVVDVDVDGIKDPSLLLLAPPPAPLNHDHIVVDPLIGGSAHNETFWSLRQCQRRSTEGAGNKETPASCSLMLFFFNRETKKKRK